MITCIRDLAKDIVFLTNFKEEPDPQPFINRALTQQNEQTINRMLDAKKSKDEKLQQLRFEQYQKEMLKTQQLNFVNAASLQMLNKKSEAHIPIHIRSQQIIQQKNEKLSKLKQELEEKEKENYKVAATAKPADPKSQK